MIEKAVNNFLKQFRSKENQHNGKAVNEYTEPSKPRISKTVMPENRGDFNDTFTHINREMNKLRFNQ